MTSAVQIVAAIMIAAVLPYVAFGQSKSDEPIKTTLCEAMKTPERFVGQIVQLRATITRGFEISALRDDACRGGVWLAWEDQGGISDEYGRYRPAEYAYVKSSSDLKHPERLKWSRIGTPPITLVQDEVERRVGAYLDEYYESAPTDKTFDCPPFFCSKYRVTVTVTGRFDHYDRHRKRAIRDVATGRIGLTSGGFGHLNFWDSQLVVQSVSDVVAVPIELSIYESRK